MVQIIENWTDIAGKILGRHPSEERRGFEKVDVKVERTAKVEGFASFLHDAVGSVISVNVPEELANNLSIAAGRTIECRVRRGKQPQDLFVHAESLRVSLVG